MTIEKRKRFQDRLQGEREKGEGDFNGIV